MTPCVEFAAWKPLTEERVIALKVKSARRVTFTEPDDRSAAVVTFNLLIAPVVAELLRALQIASPAFCGLRFTRVEAVVDEREHD